jgi:hypothetical protein
MAMQSVYLVATNNLSRFLEAIRHAQAPEKISLRFLEELGFKSTNDRLFIPLLKAMKFIDEAGKPTSRYHAFLDDTQWKVILAEGIRDAFSDLFRVNRSANKLSREALVGKLKSLAEGKASEAVLKNMAKTFLELVKLADFSAIAGSSTEQTNQSDQSPSSAEAPADTLPPPSEPPSRISSPASQPLSPGGGPTLVYRIEIVLPAVRDQAVYDAIFRSAKEHLLK